MPSEMKVNKISPASGTAITLGDSGDTFTIPSGATITNNGTQNGFGSTSASDLTSGTLPIARIADDAITNAKMADDAIDSAQIVDGAVDLAHMSSQSVDEDNLYISNAGTNGQFLSKQSGNSGGLTWADAGGGKVLQVVSASSGATASLSGTTSWTDTGHSATITPSATSSKIFVMITTGGIYQDVANQAFSYFTSIYRDSTNLGSGTHGITASYCGTMPNYDDIYCRAHTMSILDSPSSTSAIQYKIYHRTAQTGCNFHFTDVGTTKITLFEIGV